ncbi:hypothetical protein KAR91_55910 [Candidatus Pacearchaeota archaeon]|nr:hypothetical protein [Candidatus Pacearchaeota archaeon]
MSQYKELSVSPPDFVSGIGDMVGVLKTGLDALINLSKASVAAAKLQASGANAGLMAIGAVLDQIINEIEKLKGGSFNGIVAHPYAHGIRAKYDRLTDTMTLSPQSALEQVQEAFDDKGDLLAPDKVNNFWGIAFVGSAPGIADFAPILDAMGKFFSLQELKDLKKQILERWEAKEAEEVVISSGINFFGITQEELLPEYVDLLNVVQSFFEGVKSGTISASKSLDDMTDYLDKKLIELGTIVEKVSDFIDKFSFEVKEAGVHYKIFKSMKADEIKEELLKGMPKSWATSDYSVVLGLFAGSESVELIFELLQLD